MVNKYIISYVFLLSLNRFVASRLKERKQNIIFLFSWIHNHQTLTLTFNFTPIWQNLVFFLPPSPSVFSLATFFMPKKEKKLVRCEKNEKKVFLQIYCVVLRIRLASCMVLIWTFLNLFTGIKIILIHIHFGLFDLGKIPLFVALSDEIWSNLAV